MRVFDAAFFFGWVISFVLCVPIQKFAQGFVAALLGDNTPRKEGRLTLNPFAHHTALGLLFAVLISLGTSLVAWGKPMPVNSYLIRGRRVGMFLVGITAPLTNLLVAFLIWLASRNYIVNVKSDDFLGRFLLQLIGVNLFLVAFNFIPLPPLGGWDIFRPLLPNQWVQKIDPFLEEYGLLTLIIVVFFVPFLTGGRFNPLFQLVINPIVTALFQLITGTGGSSVAF